MPAAAKLFSLFAQRHVGLSALAVIWTSVSTWHWFCKCSCSLCPGFPKCWLFTCRFSRCDWYHRFGCRRIGSVAKTWCGWMRRVLANKEEASESTEYAAGEKGCDEYKSPITETSFAKGK